MNMNNIENDFSSKDFDINKLDVYTMKFILNLAWQYEFTCKNTKEGRKKAECFSRMQKTISSYMQKSIENGNQDIKKETSFTSEELVLIEVGLTSMIIDLDNTINSGMLEEGDASLEDAKEELKDYENLREKL